MVDPPLIAAFMRKRADLVRFFALRIGPGGAEDLVQDLYLRLSESAPPPDLRSPEAYLYRVGSNLLLDRIKSQKRQAAREMNWRRETVGDDLDPVAQEPPADEALASRQKLARVTAAVAALPPPVALAFRLHKFEGLTHGEVAERMGVSRSSVEKYIMTALRAVMAERNP